MDNEWFYNFFEQDYFRKTPAQVDPAIDNSAIQADFLRNMLELNSGHRILDLCCGFGRHAINMARMGYNITGFDLCERALKLARQKAQKEHLKVHLVRGDIRSLPFKNSFDCIYNVFAFGYLENDSDILGVFRNVAEGLKPGGTFLVDVINGPRILRNFMEKERAEGTDRYILQERSYDEKNKRLRSEWTFIYKDTGETNKHSITERLCSVDDLTSMTESVGLKTLNIYGDLDKTEHSENSNRIIVIAKRKQ